MSARSGKMPTTSVRRRNSLFRRPWGLDDQTWRQISRGAAVQASRSSRAAAICSAAAGSLPSTGVTTRSNWACTLGGVGLIEDYADLWGSNTRMWL